MKANINNGIYFRVEGEEGVTNALSWEVFKKMGDHLQSLFIHLAKFSLSENTVPDLESFEIEVFDFQPGSAVPGFRLRKPKQLTLHSPLDEQLTAVAQDFDDLMAIADSGNYNMLKLKYQSEEVRSTIALDLFGFVNAAPSAPVSIVRRTKTGFRKVYEVRKFKRQTLDSLVIKQFKPKDKKNDEYIARVSYPVSGKRKRATVLNIYKKAEVSYSPSHITVEDFTYYLHHPLLCKMYEEDKYFVIENPLMDLVATGFTEEEAELNFNEQFHSKYKRLNELEDSKLTQRLQRAKQALNLIVKDVIAEK